jgi:hypothetical protein
MYDTAQYIYGAHWELAWRLRNGTLEGIKNEINISRVRQI